MTDNGLPSYRDLPEADGGARSAWHLFGEDDSVGLMNLLTPEKALAAAQLVRRGAVFPLDLPLDYLTPPLFGRVRGDHNAPFQNQTTFDLLTHLMGEPGANRFGDHVFALSIQHDTARPLIST